MVDQDSYALWIIPDGEAYALTKGYIDKLSELYHLPDFEPHITILSDIRLPVMAQMHEFAHSLTPFRVQLHSEVKYPDAYFRSLHLTAHETPELVELFSKARQKFGSNGEEYFPHLSLAYSGFNLQTKHKMIEELGEIPEIEFEANQLTVVNASPQIPVSRWKVIEQFALIYA